jgi:hypothetical protein
MSSPVPATDQLPAAAVGDGAERVRRAWIVYHTSHLDSVHNPPPKSNRTKSDGDFMAHGENFGELLIEALQEAVAYKQGKRPGLRVTRYELTTAVATASPPRKQA